MTMNQERGGERVSGLIKDIHLEGLTRNGKTRQDDQFPIEFRTGNICNTNQTLTSVLTRSALAKMCEEPCFNFLLHRIAFRPKS